MSFVYSSVFHTLSLILHHRPIVSFLREAVTTRLLLTGALFLMILSGGLAASRINAVVFSCAAGGTHLLYPEYDKKGIVTSYRSACGEPHRGCVQRPGADSYECSPFMIPRT